MLDHVLAEHGDASNPWTLIFSPHTFWVGLNWQLYLQWSFRFGAVWVCLLVKGNLMTRCAHDAGAVSWCMFVGNMRACTVY